MKAKCLHKKMDFFSGLEKYLFTATVKFPFPITADMGLRKGLGIGLGFNLFERKKTNSTGIKKWSKQAADYKPRIVKGYMPSHRPWMVFMQIAPRRGKSGFCYIHIYKNHPQNRVGQNHKNVDLKSDQNHLKKKMI